MGGLNDFVRKIIRQYPNDSELGEKLRHILFDEDKKRAEKISKIKIFLNESKGKR
jgi:hypothetical protein